MNVIEQTSPIKKSTWVFYLLVVVLGAVAVYHFTELKEIARLLHQVAVPWLIFALLLQTATYYGTARLYTNLLSIYQHHTVFSRLEMYKNAIIILFFNQAIPTGGVSGSSFFWQRLNKRGVPLSQSISIIVLEMMTYQMGHFLALAGAIALFYIFNGSLHAVLKVVSILGVFIYAAIITTIIVVGSKRSLRFIGQKLAARTIANRFLQRRGIRLEEILHGKVPWHTPWSVLKEQRYHLVRPLFAQLFVIICDVLTVYALYRGLGVPIRFVYAMLGFTLTMVISMISVSPGGLAFFEGAMTLFYTALGIPVPTALIVTLLYRALAFWIPMPIGLFLYRQIQQKEHLSIGK